MPRHPPSATPTSATLVARLAAYKGFNTLATVRFVSGLCLGRSPLNGNAVLVGIIARLALWPSAYRWIFHPRPEETRDPFDLKANLLLFMVFLFDFDCSPLEISLIRLIRESHVCFILGALLKMLLYESLDYDNLRPKQGSFAPIATTFKLVTMFALDLLADICRTSRRMQCDTQDQVQCDPLTCMAMTGAAISIDGTQGELEFPCQYRHALDEVMIDGLVSSLLAPYPLSQAPSLYFDMSPSLNGESDIDVPVALDNLRHNLSRRSEAHNKTKIFDSAYSGTPSYPEKACSHFEGIAFETYSSSTAPSTASGTPVPPPYPPGASGDHDIELPAVDDPSSLTETSGCGTTMYPPGAFVSAPANYLPAIATEPLPEEDHTGLSLYPPGAFSSSDCIDLPTTVTEAYPEADETGSSLHPSGAFNSSDTIDRSPANTGLQEDETESRDESVEAGSSYDGDGSLSDSEPHPSLDEGEEPFACGIPSPSGMLERGQVASRAPYMEVQSGYLANSVQHDPSPMMAEAARLEEMYDYIRCLLTIEPDSDILDDDTAPASSTSRALPDFVIYTELYQPTSEPSIVPTILAGSDEGARPGRDYQRNDNDDGVGRSTIPIVDQSRLTHTNEVDTVKYGSRNIHNESPSADCSTDTMQPITTPICAQDASPPSQDVISTPEHDPLTNKDALEISTTTRTPQHVVEYCTSGSLSLHDLMASFHESHTRARTTSSEADYAVINKLASSTSIADPSPWGTAPATRGVRRLTVTSPRVLLRRGASCYDLHRSPSKGLCSIANEHSDPSPKHSIIGHQGLLRAFPPPF
ncbi:hypothetical protein PLEOSDRAFT_1113299 [Pleurotus ostreatus PC15]|uniref:Uncharacterized protein n=1 Tax=Pleurotus ostreatus (strain PC15) TaxID=1137138 RepID=A0A067NG23_PLEO1|nr:hypothetical protein PLEOSDRAFT_1113299 [Pleurotus ostreatus PC15]